MDKKTLERNSTGSSKQNSKLTSDGRITPAYSGERLRTQSRSEREHNQSKNRQRSSEDEIPEDVDTTAMSPRTKANKEAVFKKLQLFYLKKYPGFQIGKYLYKEENSKKRSNSMETGENEPYFNVQSTSHNKKGQVTGFDDYELMEKVRRLKQLKGGNWSNKKYEKVTSKVDSGMGSPRSPPTKMLSMDSSPSSLRKERMGNKKESQNTFNLDGGTHETSVDFNEPSRKDLHAPRLPLIRAQSINCDYPLPNTRSPSPSISMTRREIKGRVQRSQTFNQSRVFNSPVLKAIHDSPVIKPQSGFDLASESSKYQSPDMKRINQFNFEMIPEFDNMSPIQGALVADSSMTNSPEILVAKNYAIPSNYSPVLSAATYRGDFNKKNGRKLSFSLDKSQAKNLMNQSVNLKVGPKKVRADPLLQIKNDFNKMKQTMNQTYTEVKEKSVPAKIEWLVYHSQKDYNKIERRLGDTKPRLYNFEDYIKSVYGKSFSTDEYGMAMKPHRLAVNPAYNNAKRDKELKELIDQVKREGFDIVEGL